MLTDAREEGGGRAAIGRSAGPSSGILGGKLFELVKSTNRTLLANSARTKSEPANEFLQPSKNDVRVPGTAAHRLNTVLRRLEDDMKCKVEFSNATRDLCVIFDFALRQAGGEAGGAGGAGGGAACKSAGNAGGLALGTGAYNTGPPSTGPSGTGAQGADGKLLLQSDPLTKGGLTSGSFAHLVGTGFLHGNAVANAVANAGANAGLRPAPARRRSSTASVRHGGDSRGQTAAFSPAFSPPFSPAFSPVFPSGVSPSGASPSGASPSGASPSGASPSGASPPGTTPWPASPPTASPSPSAPLQPPVCLACFEIGGELLECAIPQCRRRFCHKCATDSRAGKMDLMTFPQQVCAVCAYQAERQRPDPPSWHWNFHDEIDAQFARALRESLPASEVRGLFLEIHEQRQPCWRRRSPQGRKHYSFKHYGGILECRLVALLATEIFAHLREAVFAAGAGLPVRARAALATASPAVSAASATLSASSLPWAVQGTGAAPGGVPRETREAQETTQATAHGTAPGTALGTAPGWATRTFPESHPASQLSAWLANPLGPKTTLTPLDAPPASALPRRKRRRSTRSLNDDDEDVVFNMRTTSEGGTTADFASTGPITRSRAKAREGAGAAGTSGAGADERTNNTELTQVDEPANGETLAADHLPGHASNHPRDMSGTPDRGDSDTANEGLMNNSRMDASPRLAPSIRV